MNNDNFVPENNPENEVNLSPEIARRISRNMFHLIANFDGLFYCDLPRLLTDELDIAFNIVKDVKKTHNYRLLELVYERLQSIKVAMARRNTKGLKNVILAEYHCMEILADVIVVKPRNEPPSYGNIGWVNGGES